MRIYPDAGVPKPIDTTSFLCLSQYHSPPGLCPCRLSLSAPSLRESYSAQERASGAPAWARPQTTHRWSWRLSAPPSLRLFSKLT